MPASLSPLPTAHHLLLPFAVCSSPAWLPTMQALPPDSTRHLRQLLWGMQVIYTAAGEAQSLSPPHERALAQAQGLISDWNTEATLDGLIPWAARDAVSLFSTSGDKAWAWITPCHWAMGREHATMTDPAALALRENESRTLLTAMQPYFETDGITLHYLSPERWLAEGELFRNLPTASLDRVLGRNVDPWLPSSKSVEGEISSLAPKSGEAISQRARTLRRLQNEMQMLLYTHPLNDERSALRQLPVNSFWISGTGTLPLDLGVVAEAPRLVSAPRSLAQAVFNDDWVAYAQAWAALDAGEVAQLLARQRAGEPVRLTMCGERGAQTLASVKTGLIARISSVLMPKTIWNGREQL